MPYIIPSSAITPGTVYQPGKNVPAYIAANARELACIRGGAYSPTRMLGQLPANSGTRRDGEEGRTKKLNGTNQAVRVSDNPAFNWSTALSVSVWAKNDNADITAENFLLGKYDTGANKREWAFGFDEIERVKVFFGSSGGADANIWTSTSSYSPDVWANYAFTYDAGTLKVFRNGVEIAGSVTRGTIPATILNETADLIIGGYLNNNTPTILWEGQLFDARIYSSVLSNLEISDIYEDGTSKIQFAGKTLTALYKLDEQSGTTCYDSSGNSLHGTIENPVDNEATQDIVSFQNQLGYNLSGAVYIPRDESEPSNDVLANPLTYTGRRPNDLKINDSNCLKLNGANQAVRVSDNAAFDWSTALSVSVWAKNNKTSVTELQVIFSKFDYGNNNREWTIYIDINLKLVITFGDPSDGTLEGSFESSNQIAIDSFNNIAFTFSSGELKVFLNAIEINGTTTGSIPSSIFNGTCDLCIGSHNNNGSSVFEWDGQVFDARIYSSVLSASEIQSIYDDFRNLIDDPNLVCGYSCSEGAGTVIHDYGPNALHGNIENPVDNNATQDLVHWNSLVGCSKRMYFGGSQYVAVSGMAASEDYFGSCTISAKIFINSPSATNIICCLSDSAYRIYLAGGTWRVNSLLTGINASFGYNEFSFSFNSSGDAVSFVLNGIQVWTGSASAGVATDSIFRIGAQKSLFANFSGIIWDFSLTGSSVKNFSLNGYGNQNEDWFDTTGTVNDGDISVNGSPSSIYLPATAAGLDPFGNALTDPFIDGKFNRSESTIDFNPDSTPEMGATQLGITVPSAHAFGDSFAASTQIFSRQRDTTEDRFVVMPEAQSGDALATIQKYTQP